jgi:hypothetical protein
MALVEVAPALPRIDEHEVTIGVSAGQAWLFVVAALARLTARPAWRAYAKAIRCEPDRAGGAPATIGATVPGFRVTRCVVPAEWELEGSHLFSRYALTFRIDPLDGARCRVRAESRAEFPGVHGTVYRALVIGTGGHAVGVRGILQGIKREAERSRSEQVRA